MSAWSPRLLIPSIALIAAGAFVVHAQQTNDGTINACAGASGILRMVAEGEACRAGETPVSLGSGLAGYEIVTVDHVFAENTTAVFAQIAIPCPDGKKVMGGGAAALVDFSGVIVVGRTSTITFANASYPADENTWVVGYEWVGAGSVVGVRGFATCAY